MAKRQRSLVKPVLDKDLRKFTYLEEVNQHVASGLVRPGLGFLVLVVAGLLGTSFATSTTDNAAIIVTSVIAAYMAMNIGANNVTNNVGAAVGSRAITIVQALVIAAIFEVAGAFIGSGRVISTISTGIIDTSAVADKTDFIWAMMAALLAAALWTNMATWLRAPISTTHTVVGCILGAGVASSGPGGVHWLSVASIAAGWVVAPLIGGTIAAVFLAIITRLITSQEDRIGAARRWVPVLTGIMAGVFTIYLVIKGLGRVYSFTWTEACLIGLASGIVIWAVSRPVVMRQSSSGGTRGEIMRGLFRLPLLFAAALMSFAHGSNDVSNAVGPLSAIIQAAHGQTMGMQVSMPAWVLPIGALGLAAGMSLFGPRLIRIVGEKITKLNPARAYCISLSTAVTVIVASIFGFPVSTTHIAIGSVFGVGFYREWQSNRMLRLAREASATSGDGSGNTGVDEDETSPEEMRRRYLVRRSHFMTIVGAWIITLPIAAALSATVYTILSLSLN